MFPYKKYCIKTTDRFNPDDFPKVLNELADINTGTAGLPGIYKESIIISFLKDRSIQNDWLKANPVLTGLFNSGNFTTSHLESLFDSCKMNNRFLEDYEEYIRKNLS